MKEARALGARALGVRAARLPLPLRQSRPTELQMRLNLLATKPTPRAWRLLLIVGLLASACARESDPRAPNDSIAVAATATRADSAGWRFTYLAGPGLRLRYPIDRVLGVRNEWKPDCRTPTPIFADDPPDSSLVDRLVVRSAPASFDNAVAMAGFVRRVNERDTTYSLDLPDGNSFGWADTMTAGPWRALSVAEVFISYLDEGDSVTYEVSRNTPDATPPPSQVHSVRVVAVGPAAGQCRTVLAIQTHAHLENSPVLDSAIVRAILEGAHQ